MTVICTAKIVSYATNSVRVPERGASVPASLLHQRLLSIRSERDLRGGSEDPHPITAWIRASAECRLRCCFNASSRSAPNVICAADQRIRTPSRRGFARARSAGFAAASHILSIRSERDLRGGSEDPHHITAVIF